METITRGITYTDLMHRGRPRIIATVILQSPGGVALVDPGPTSCLDTLRASLADAGIGIGDLRALLLTHIHLDHAGAAGSLLAENPDIEVRHVLVDACAMHLIQRPRDFDVIVTENTFGDILTDEAAVLAAMRGAVAG